MPGARGGGGENDGGRGVEEILAVVFANAEDAEAGFVGMRDFLEQIA